MEEANGIERPLLSASNDTAQTDGSGFVCYGRYRCWKSASLHDAISAESYFNCTNLQIQSIFGNFHPSFRKVFICLSIYFGIGTMCFYFMKDQINGRKTNGVVDAVYFCMVTMTTVGYGDLVPDSPPTKLLSVLLSTPAWLLLAYYWAEREMSLVNALHFHNKVSPSEILDELKAHRIGYKCVPVFISLLVLIISGTVFLVIVEKLNVIDAFYCVCSCSHTIYFVRLTGLKYMIAKK